MSNQKSSQNRDEATYEAVVNFARETILLLTAMLDTDLFEKHMSNTEKLMMQIKFLFSQNKLISTLDFIAL